MELDHHPFHNTICLCSERELTFIYFICLAVSETQGVDSREKIILYPGWLSYIYLT